MTRVVQAGRPGFEFWFEEVPTARKNSQSFPILTDSSEMARDGATKGNDSKEVESMSTKIDRRTFLKMMGGAGAAAAYVSAAPPAFGERLLSDPAAPSAQIARIPGAQLAALPKDKLTTIYTRMQRSRQWETKMKDLFVGGADGLYGAFHAYVGEEAIANGVVGALNPDDYIVSTHRGHGHLIAKDGDLNKMSAEIFFRQGGYNKAFGGSMHITDLSKGILGMNGIVGASWYIAAGAAYSAKVRQSGQVAVAFAGEGASNSPYFFSAVRNARNYNLPAVFVIENNGYAITIPADTNIPTGRPAAYAAGAGVPNIVVDGNDVAEVYSAAATAIDRARNGGGPTVIEGTTFRWYDHAGFAGAKEGVDAAWGLPYRSDEEVKQWMARDPIARYRAFLLDQKLFTEDELTKIESDVKDQVEASVEFARSSPAPVPEDGVLNVYSKGSVAPTQFLQL